MDIMAVIAFLLTLNKEQAILLLKEEIAGIGPIRARSIVSYLPHVKSVWDLLSVPGLGIETVSRVEDWAYALLDTHPHISLPTSGGKDEDTLPDKEKSRMAPKAAILTLYRALWMAYIQCAHKPDTELLTKQLMSLQKGWEVFAARHEEIDPAWFAIADGMAKEEVHNTWIMRREQKIGFSVYNITPGLIARDSDFLNPVEDKELAEHAMVLKNIHPAIRQAAGEFLWYGLASKNKAPGKRAWQRRKAMKLVRENERLQPTMEDTIDRWLNDLLMEIGPDEFARRLRAEAPKVGRRRCVSITEHILKNGKLFGSRLHNIGPVDENHQPIRDAGKGPARAAVNRGAVLRGVRKWALARMAEEGTIDGVVGLVEYIDLDAAEELVEDENFDALDDLLAGYEHAEYLRAGFEKEDDLDSESWIDYMSVDPNADNDLDPWEAIALTSHEDEEYKYSERDMEYNSIHAYCWRENAWSFIVKTKHNWRSFFNKAKELPVDSKKRRQIVAAFEHHAQWTREFFFNKSKKNKNPTLPRHVEPNGRILVGDLADVKAWLTKDQLIQLNRLAVLSLRALDPRRYGRWTHLKSYEEHMASQGKKAEAEKAMAERDALDQAVTEEKERERMFVQIPQRRNDEGELVDVEFADTSSARPDENVFFTEEF